MAQAHAAGVVGEHPEGDVGVLLLAQARRGASGTVRP